MYIRLVRCELKNGDITSKYSVCKSYRCKTSGKALYYSKYLTSIRESDLRNPVNQLPFQKFWTKFNLALDKINVARDSDVALLLKIGIKADWQKRGFPC